MTLPFEIKTIEKSNEVSTVINKSNFIAQVHSISAETEVKELLSEAKKKYYDASHHCYAFKLADGTFRYSDAGEPGGRAGIRIMNAIDHFKLSNQLVIVSRIFGGVKLGVGPLGKAYYESAYNVIDKSKISNKQLFQRAIIITNYEQISSIQRILSLNSSIITESDFKETIKLSCLLKKKEIESILKQVSNLGKKWTKFNLLNQHNYQ